MTSLTSERAYKFLQIKAARGLHKKLRAQGRVPGAEARIARKLNARRRREERAAEIAQTLDE